MNFRNITTFCSVRRNNVGGGTSIGSAAILQRPQRPQRPRQLPLQVEKDVRSCTQFHLKILLKWNERITNTKTTDGNNDKMMKISLENYITIIVLLNKTK